MPRIDEYTRRRPTFREGRKVTMADGQEWHVVRPLVIFTPCEGTDSGFTETLRTEDPGGRYLELVRARRDAEGDYEFIAAEVALGKYLLQWNYELTDAEVGELMPFIYMGPDEDEDESEGLTSEEQRLIQIRKNVMKVVKGAAPKRPTAGTGSSPTPPA